MVRKNWRSRKTENASPKKLGRIERPERADQVELGEQHVERHRRHLLRQHHRGQDDDEGDLAQPPAQPGERVRHGHAGDDDADRREPGVEQGVAGGPEQPRLREHVREVREPERVRPDARAGRLIGRHERGEDHEHERNEEHQGEGDEDAPLGDHGEEPLPAHRAHPRPPAPHTGPGLVAQRRRPAARQRRHELTPGMCTKRRDATSSAPVTASATRKSTTAIAEA